MTNKRFIELVRFLVLITRINITDRLTKMTFSSCGCVDLMCEL